MYLALLFLLAGTAALTGSIWMHLAVPALLIELYLAAVKAEEAYLERKFGEHYLEYKAQVRRWL